MFLEAITHCQMTRSGSTFYQFLNIWINICSLSILLFILRLIFTQIKLIPALQFHLTPFLLLNMPIEGMNGYSLIADWSCCFVSWHASNCVENPPKVYSLPIILFFYIFLFPKEEDLKLFLYFSVGGFLLLLLLLFFFSYK